MFHIKDRKASCLLALTWSVLLCLLLWNTLNPASTYQKYSYLAEVETFPEVEIYKCKETIEHYGGIKARICLKPLEGDHAMSSHIDSLGSWEAPLVSVMLKAMSMYPSAVFLDIGSNIGTYTVLMAAAGRHVVAVDAMLNNLAYIHHSLTVGNTTQLVRLLNNPVSDKKEALFPVNDAGGSNPGATRLVPVQLFTGGATIVGPPVTSTTLLDLLNFINTKTVIVKLDVEGYECKVLHNYLAHGHPSYYLPYICMEWAGIANNHGSSCPDLQGLVDALYSNSYTPYLLPFQAHDQGVPDNLTMVEKDKIMVQEMSWDLLWVHKDAPALFW